MRCKLCGRKIGEFEEFLVCRKHLTIHQKLDPSYPLYKIGKYNLMNEDICLVCRNSSTVMPT